MRVAVLGTGAVGQALAGKLVDLGHDVAMGTRSPDAGPGADWAAGKGERASVATFADAAAAGDLVINATAGSATLAALDAAGSANLDGKVLVDVANALDFSRGTPPSLFVGVTDSLGEQVQRRFPAARVVKALNTVTAAVMVEPSLVTGTHHVFIAGDDPSAKDDVRRLLSDFGWPASSVIDLGGISCARGTEAYLLLWLNLYGTYGSPMFNINVVRHADA